MVKYSYSRLSSFDNCGLQYKFNYLDKSEKDFENSIEAFMGSQVHDALEELYKKQKLGEILSLESVLKLYKTNWKKDFSEEIKIVKENLNSSHYFDLGIRYLTDYYNHYYPFNQDYTIGLEIEVNLLLNESYSLYGFIDRLSIKDDVYYIHDYKTSSNLPSTKEINDNKQLAIYALAIKEKYPDVKDVVLVWHFLAFDKEISITKKEEDYTKLKTDLINKINEIESLPKEKYKPKESILCNWCPYASKCPVKMHEIKTKQLSIVDFKKDLGVNLVNEYLELIAQKEDINNKLSELETKIYDYANREDLKNISGSLGALRIFEYDSFSLPTKGSPKYDALKQILKENNLENLFSIDNYWLSKSINTNTIESEVLEKILPLVEKKQVKKLYPIKKEL